MARTPGVPMPAVTPYAPSMAATYMPQQAPVTYTTAPVSRPVTYTASPVNMSYAAAPTSSSYVAAPAAQGSYTVLNQRRRVVGRVGMMPRERSLSLYPRATHLLVIALDYKGTANELSCTVDGNNLQALARACGVQDIVALYDQMATKARVEQSLHAISTRCGPEDTVVVCYSGHGTSVTDYDGDEVDAQDEAYVLYDDNGQAIPPTENSLMTDDELADILISKLPAGISLIVVSDCCHSGTVCDLHKPAWRGRKAVSISGCRDTQTSGDTGHGGICTHSMLMGIEALQKEGKTNYSVGELFRKTCTIDDEVFESAQDITCHCSHGVSMHGITWPLIPKTAYTAPYRQHKPFSVTPTILPPQPQPQSTILQPQPIQSTQYYTSVAPGGSYVTDSSPQPCILTPGMSQNISEAFGLRPQSGRISTWVNQVQPAPLLQFSQSYGAGITSGMSSGYGTPAPAPPIIQYSSAGGSCTPPMVMAYN
eukprot:TRINITY_DN45042_c0_g1_i1.p1 TRINITY_DN45042_c0_g1~~TRINITY_DN45042_c0_g1_i1.p1  ORF type:complete len:481 (-),score=56.08 TRINITY_DN45042_c0_g1_i1:85-1527(-)